jgi:hypothetical protein
MNQKTTTKHLGLSTPEDIARRIAAAAAVSNEQKLPSNAPAVTATPAPATPVLENMATGTTLRREKKPAKDKKKSTPAPTKRLPLDLPDYLHRELRTDGAQLGISAKHIVMLALRKDGYTIHQEDMNEDGRGAHK